MLPEVAKEWLTVAPLASAPSLNDQLTDDGVKLTSAARPRMVPVRKWVNGSAEKVAACPTLRLESDTLADIAAGVNETEPVSTVVTPGVVTTVTIVANVGPGAVGTGAGFLGVGVGVGLGAGLTGIGTTTFGGGGTYRSIMMIFSTTGGLICTTG